MSEKVNQMEEISKIKPSLQSPIPPFINDHELFSGQVTLSGYGNSCVVGCRIWFTWNPTPTVRFELSNAPTGIALFSSSPSIVLDLPGGTKITHAQVTGVSNPLNFPGHSNTITGEIGERVVYPADSQVSYAVFSLPNFDTTRASETVRSGKRISASRNLLCGGGWIITIDEVDNHSDLVKHLKQKSGYAFTHVGRIEREDGKTFNAVETREICEGLKWYLTFCCGRWTEPILAHGYDSNQKLSWTLWDFYRIDPYANRITWLDPLVCEHFEKPFEGFMKRWADKLWNEVVITAIHWHVEANACAGSIEGSIILLQAAFELLSSVVFVETGSWISPDGYDKLAAADRLRMLFKWFGIPTEIPSSMTGMMPLIKALDWHDAPKAMTEIRNTITHPTMKNRQKYAAKHTSESRSDAWMLGLWYLELCLLKLFEYNGTYGSRIVSRIKGQVAQVPWSATSPPP